MKTITLLAVLLVSLSVLAQSTWRDLLRVDPKMSNGNFILNEDKCQQLDVRHVHVQLRRQQAQPGGGFISAVLQTISIRPEDHYGHVDMHLIPDLQPGDVIDYNVEAVNASDSVVLSFHPWDGTWPRQEYCRYTCNANSYAWALLYTMDGQMTNTIFSFIDAANGQGQYYYLYVKDDDWGQFMDQYTPSDWCLDGGGTWSEILTNWNQVDVLHGVNLESSYLDYMGTSMGASPGMGYAIAKKKGPWCNQHANTQEYLGVEYCSTDDVSMILQRFNSDPHADSMFNASGGLDTLFCDGQYAYGGGGGWGDWDISGCTQSFTHSDGTEDLDGDGELDPVGWIDFILDCQDGDPYLWDEDHQGLELVSNIVINHWYPGTPGPSVNIHIPDEADPKLIPVPRTQLEPGLYEYVVHFNNGLVWRRFQSYDQPKVIRADFASFTNVSVYPVPVDRRTFSVDFETVAPMNVNVKVIDNQGTIWYQKSVSFNLAGLNKHVITMPAQWPNGLYHVIITFDDGSTESIGITVQQ